MTDMLGVPIVRGTTVCYASRKKSQMWLRVMRVLDVKGNHISGLLLSGRAVSIERPDSSNLIVTKGTAF